jgi:hypothetical protein
MHEAFRNIGSPFVRLAEECSEVIKVCMKIERFGLDNYHPSSNILNIDSLKEEIKDVELCIEEVKQLIKKEENVLLNRN